MEKCRHKYFDRFWGGRERRMRCLLRKKHIISMAQCRDCPDYQPINPTHVLCRGTLQKEV